MEERTEVALNLGSRELEVVEELSVEGVEYYLV